ncbi:hypothetical protein FGO68_gene4253 [Halteria grandinella]|uniref:Uncharacterized protein n=1 Tax=Halteria grandinella TaxID=5974 RepID=A0A8J8T9K3_HALGN|nr:hypothetical protein FGO68_gene4253 [Halteria grandinella]
MDGKFWNIIEGFLGIIANQRELNCEIRRFQIHGGQYSIFLQKKTWPLLINLLKLILTLKMFTNNLAFLLCQCQSFYTLSQAVLRIYKELANQYLSGFTNIQNLHLSFRTDQDQVSQ